MEPVGESYGDYGISEWVYFDKQGVHHNPEGIYFGKLGKNSILLSYAKIEQGLVGSLEYLDQDSNPIIFIGNIDKENNVNFKSLSMGENKKLEFEGRLNGDEISGKWAGTDNEDMEISALRDPGRFSGAYQWVKKVIYGNPSLPINEDIGFKSGNLYLTMNDNGIYLIFFYENDEGDSEAPEDVDYGLGYPISNQRDELAWKSYCPESYSQCRGTILFSNIFEAHVPIPSCTSSCWDSDFLVGIYRKMATSNSGRK
jgi:hypothetical protein